VAPSRRLVLVSLLLLGACGRIGLRSTAPVAEPAAAPAPTVAVMPSVTATRAPVTPPAADPVVEGPAVPAEPAVALIDPPAAEAPPVTWDIDVLPYESHARVEYFVGRFTGAARNAFEVALERQSRYAPLIHERLRAGGLPEDMIYLPLIESWYDPHAYSRAAAVGMWQFMTGTARGVGLRVDWWIDERRDPVRATDGAVIFLNQLRESFGSVYLAAAAYNGGPGRISRGLAQHASKLEGAEGDDQFFALAEAKALRAETADYVPKLIAAALVGKDPTRYGISARRIAPFAWDSVLVPAATPLAAVAKATGVPIDTIRDYNPQVLRGMTAPAGAATWLRVPVGTASGFADRFDKLDAGEREGVKRVVTKTGDYMSKMAKANGLTAKQLSQYNPQATRLKNGNLHAGQRILVPRLDVVRAARDVPDPKIERYGTSASGSYVVKRGDALGLIARKHGTTVARLKALNKLKSDQIRVGQKLRVR
jgi:membrane-bound lytic murein transglycosylase D